jgi:hypothetical protein
VFGTRGRAITIPFYIDAAFRAVSLKKISRRFDLQGRPAPDFLFELFKKFDGRVPPLVGCSYHFYIVKRDGNGPKQGKEWAGNVATALQNIGFKVWFSQFEQELGRPIDIAGMQQGIRDSAMVLLLPTPGIFGCQRVHITDTELTFAVEDCRKPVAIMRHGGALSFPVGGDSRIPACGHIRGCCEGVKPEFQPIARALGQSDMVMWSGSGYKKEASLKGLVKKFLQRDELRKKFEADLEKERKVGPCMKEAERVAANTTKTN